MPYRYQVPLAEEDVGFTEGNVPADQLRGLHYDEQRVAVGFDFGALVCLLSVFDSEVMQVEFFLQL